MAHLFLSHFPKGWVRGQVFRSFMVVCLDLRLQFPDVVLENCHDHEGATHQTTVPALALALLVGDMSSIFVFAATVALQPEAV